MIALKTLLMMVGVLLMTVAAGIPMHGLWMQLRYVMKRKSHKDRMIPESGEMEPEPAPVTWKGPVALALVGCLPLADGSEHGGGAERNGWRARQPDWRDGAGDPLSGTTFCHSDGRKRADVRSARSHVHRGRCGLRQARDEEQR